MENQKFEKRLCIVCNKYLVSIGTSRKNGKVTHTDWETRNMHKKCLKTKMQTGGLCGNINFSDYYANKLI